MIIPTMTGALWYLEKNANGDRSLKLFLALCTIPMSYSFLCLVFVDAVHADVGLSILTHALIALWYRWTPMINETCKSFSEHIYSPNSSHLQCDVPSAGFKYVSLDTSHLHHQSTPSLTITYVLQRAICIVQLSPRKWKSMSVQVDVAPLPKVHGLSLISSYHVI